MSTQYISYSSRGSGSGSGIATYANFAAFPASAPDGTLALALDTDILYVYSTSAVAWIPIASPSSVLSIGTIDSLSKAANGAKISGNALVFQTADGSFPGLVSIGAQSFSGIKNFNSNIFAANLSGTNSGDVTLTAVGASPNANAATLTGQALNLQPANGSFPGVVTTGAQTLAGAKTLNATLSLSSNLISNVLDPVSAQDAATKNYVDALANGLSWKQQVRSATTAALPSYVYNNGASGVGATITGVALLALPAQDGVTLANGNRLLVKDETAGNAPFNGIYIVTVLGSVGVAFVLTRSTDLNTAAEFVDATVQVSPEASTQGGYGYRQNTDPVVVGTTAVAFVNFSIGTSYTFSSGVQLVGAAVSANVDNSTIAVSANQLIVKDGGVTNIKLAAMADKTVKGNKSGSSAAPSDLALSNVTETGSGVLTISNGTAAVVAASPLTIQLNLPSAAFYVGNSSNFPAGVAMSGDASLANTGAVTLGSNVVSNAKFRQSAALSLVGNATNSTANVADIAAASDFQIMRRSGTALAFGSVDLSQSGAVGVSILNVANGGHGVGTLAAHGVVIGNGTSAVNVTSAGTSGQVFTSNGPSADPTFQNSASTNYAVTSKSGNYNVATSDAAILADASGAGFTLTLPTPSGNTGKFFIVKKIDTSFNAVTITHNASETIDGSASTTLNTQYESASLFTDGTNWFINAHVVPSAWTSYTPTFTGFGTVSTQSFWWRRVGDSIEVKGRFTTGTNTGVEARVSLPSGLTSSSSSKINATLELCGSANRNTDSADTIFSMLIEPSVAYVTFGSNAAGTNFGTAALTKLNATQFLSNGDQLSLWAKLPITGWNG